MHITLLTHSREDLLHAGRTLGHFFLRANRQDRPWTVTLGDAAKSGKSLIVLAADSVMNPKAYPNGITAPPQPLQFPDEIIYMRPRNSLVFLNEGGVYCGKQAFDARLAQLERNFPAAKVIMCSNMQRTELDRAFNYSAQGMQSDRLDMNIDFRISGKAFERRLSITTEDPALYVCLQKSGLELG